MFILIFYYKVLGSVLVGETGPDRFQMFFKRLLTISGSPYRYISHYKRLSWPDARAFCRNASGGDLASIHNMVEHLKIMQEINWKEKVWIGGYREKIGNKIFWSWSDKTLVDYPLGDIKPYNCMTMSMDDIFKSDNCQTPHYCMCKVDTSGRVVKFSNI